MNELSLSDFKARQKLLVGENRVKQAFEEILIFLEGKDQHLHSRTLHQKSRYNYNENMLLDGRLADADASLVFNRINASLLDIIEEINPLIFQQSDKLHKSNTQNLLNRIPNSNSLFVGRDRELAEFKAAFDRYNFFAIEGVGGIGKTEFAIECIRRYVEDKKRILWVSPLMKFDVMVHQAGYGEMLKIEQLNDFQKFKNFEGLLDRDNCIVFLEDFHDNTDDNYTRFFEQFSLQNAKVIVITRFLPPGLEPGTVIKLEGLGDQAISFARDERNKKSQYEEITDEDLEKLCKVVEGHPLSIELGVQLLSYGERAEDIVKVFTNGEYQGIKKISQLSQRLLFEVLKNDKTSQAERDLLFRFSVYRDKVSNEAIAALFENPKIKYPLSQLIEKSLIRYKQKLYDCAPLIREFCLPRLENAGDIHRRAADYFLTRRDAQFNPALEENIIYHLRSSGQWKRLGTYIEEHGQTFIRVGQVNLLKDTIDALTQHNITGPVFSVYEAEIHIHLSNYEEARKCILAALKIYQQQDDLRGQSIALNVLGRVKWTTNLTDALTSLKESYRLAEESGDKGLMVDALNLIANNYFEEGDMDKATESSERSLILAEEISDQYEVGMALNVLGRIHSLRGDYDNANEYLQKGFRLFELIDHKVMMVSTLNNIGSVLWRKKRFEDAISEFSKCLKITSLIGAKLETGRLHVNIGYALIESNDIESAILELKQGLSTYENIQFDQGRAAALNGIGLVYVKQKKYAAALSQYEKSLSICNKISYKLGLIYLYENIGELLLHNDDAISNEKAGYHLIYSVALRNKMNVNASKSMNLLKALRTKINSNESFHQLISNSSQKLQPDLRETLDINLLLTDKTVDPVYAE